MRQSVSFWVQILAGNESGTQHQCQEGQMHIPSLSERQHRGASNRSEKAFLSFFFFLVGNHVHGVSAETVATWNNPYLFKIAWAWTVYATLTNPSHNPHIRVVQVYSSLTQKISLLAISQFGFVDQEIDRLDKQGLSRSLLRFDVLSTLTFEIEIIFQVLSHMFFLNTTTMFECIYLIELVKSRRDKGRRNRRILPSITCKKTAYPLNSCTRFFAGSEMPWFAGWIVLCFENPWDINPLFLLERIIFSNEGSTWASSNSTVRQLSRTRTTTQLKSETCFCGVSFLCCKHPLDRPNQCKWLGRDFRLLSSEWSEGLWLHSPYRREQTASAQASQQDKAALAALMESRTITTTSNDVNEGDNDDDPIAVQFFSWEAVNKWRILVCVSPFWAEETSWDNDSCF